MGEAINALGHEGAGDADTVLGRAAGPAALRQQTAEGNHGADSDEVRLAVADGADGGGQHREQLLLEDVGELRELCGKSELHWVS